MGQYTSYWLYQKYEKRGSQEAIPVYPNVYSVDGDGTMSKVIKIENDAACGYVPTGTTQYRWVNLDPSVDYYCDECPTPQYRWTNSGTTCVGYDKYQRAIKQVSYDNGQTWENVSPAEYSATTLIQADSPDCGYVEPIYRWIKSDDTICVEATAQYRTISGTPYCTGYDKYVDVYSQVSYDSGSTWTTTATTPTLVEADSEDCGYVPPTPPTPTGAKFSATYNDGRTYSRECDGQTTIGTATTQPLAYEASAMTSAVIGSCVTSIGYAAFWGCPSLTAITIPDTVTYIGDSAFNACSSLTAITIPDSVTSIDTYAFWGCSGLTTCTLGTGLTSIGNRAFWECSSLTAITMPNSVTSIGDNAFNTCTSLTSVNIPSSLTVINENVFSTCRSLSSITIPNSVTAIGYGAFQYCSSLTSIDIPNSVTSISGSTFLECTSLSSATIGSGVTSIGNYTFYRCSGLISVIVEATAPPTLGKDVFYNTNANLVIYVPASSVSAYKSATNWSTYADRIQPIP